MQLCLNSSEYSASWATWETELSVEEHVNIDTDKPSASEAASRAGVQGNITVSLHLCCSKTYRLLKQNVRES